MRLPFSNFVNNLLITINRALGQLTPIGGWLNVTAFEIACKVAGVEPRVSLFSSLFSVTHDNFQSYFFARCRRNILIKKRPNKIPDKRLLTKWFFARGGMAIGVPCIWTLKSEARPLSPDTESNVIAMEKIRSVLPQDAADSK
ncbi:hypothetical protein LIER_23369 [Lithospermum erythrorhizon]|uniref:Transposase (putative) gypsy type domain-containing protein n=1 Tax=Lithospermum erythrorhizon TaxID=34254 RepID=A0AAV3QYJ7_LITER